MPSIKSLREITEPVTVERGSIKITLQAQLEKINVQDKEYQKLLQRSLELRQESNKINGEIQQQVSDIAKLNAPKQEAFFAFRETVVNHLVGITKALESGDHETASTSASAALDEIDKIDQTTLPSSDEVDKRAQAATRKVENSRKKLEAITGQDIPRNVAERICYLCSAWDVTESDEPDAPMWPLTPENLLTFSADLLLDILQAIEKKVGLASPQTMSDFTS